MGAGLRSSIYECEVVHRRLRPKKHAFRYRLFFLDLDLDELDAASDRLHLFSHNRFNLFQLRDQDFLGEGTVSLREKLSAHLAQEGIELPADSRIRLVTMPRIAGYIFNPVCFYFISDSEGRPLQAVVEVTNTFREKKAYTIRQPEAGRDRFRMVTPKHFYVSPFSSLETEFDFRLAVPGEQIEIHINDLEGGETTLVSWIRGRRRELDNRRLVITSIKYPLLTLQVIAKIHWQALKLWLRKLPFHRKAERPDLQNAVLRPHSTLTEHKKTS